MPLSSTNTDTFRRVLYRNVTLPLVLGVVSAGVFLAIVAYLLSAMSTVEKTDQVITRTLSIEKMDLDMESGLRGFLITNDARFLASLDQGRAQIRNERDRLREQLQANPVQLQRLVEAERMQGLWDRYADEQISLKRSNANYDAVFQLEQGRQMKQAVRRLFDQIHGEERRLRLERVQRANDNARLGVLLFVVFMLGMGGVLAWRGRSDLMHLSRVFEQALEERRHQAEILEAQGWLREGQARLTERLAPEQTLEGVAHGALEFFSDYLDARVGALYVPQEDGSLVCAGTWGWPEQEQGVGTVLPLNRTLEAECAAARRQIALSPAPAGYLRVSSGLGEAAAQSVLIAPIENERHLSAVVEIGLLRPLAPRDGELLQMVAVLLGSAVDAARNRRRMQDILEETQQLNEELQVQQEELRTANEELEEQSHALKESQATLENQQAELEQTNLRLSEQTQQLADQRDELRVAQGELQERADELQRASAYKSEFLANMSHELRTPLNSALILARLLAENPQGNLHEEQVKFAESIYASGNDLLQLINDVLDIAKVEAGKLEIRPEVTPLAGMAGGLRTMFEPLATVKGLSLEVNVAPDVPAQMWTDRQRVEQILRNLLSNAVKFTDKGGVALQVRKDGERIVFDVRDSGIGIAPSKQELIFEAFRQADGTVSRRYGGTGLGLSISRDLARLLGGTLTVSSTPGEGSTFTLSLPAEYEGATAAPAPEPRPAPVERKPAAVPARKPATAPAVADDRESPGGDQRTILVIEDDVAFARILLDLAHELGYRCLVAHHAAEGVELAVREQPRAVLLDMRLPDDSGLSVLQQLKDNSKTRHIPVHVISVDDRVEAALQMGAVGYAFKPASPEKLREIFGRLEAKLSQKVKRVLLVEDDARQRDAIASLIGEEGVEITAVAEGGKALEALAGSVFDCMIIDLQLPDMTGEQLLERMASGDSRSFPPVIVYTGRDLDRKEEERLQRYSRSIIIKGARSPERLLDEVTLFLHQVESDLSTERQKMLRTARSRDKAFEGRRILVVDDDVRNIYALTSALEHQGASVEVARNGIEALKQLGPGKSVDLVLMDIMMPEMDGYTAMKEIRKDPRWKKLPIIAITAKAMRDDQEKCLAAGASDYMAKPIELERLFSLIRVWLPKI